MGFLKRTNKKFDYEPRHYESDKDGSPFAMEQKFDKFRHTIGSGKGMKGNFSQALTELKETKAKGANRIILILIMVFVILFLWIIDFDLSIFS
ncbi:riboflavin synthase subunit beta [Patiriisocius sp. Uisw_047]|uniref:riboflavin synthase subunit beta n=1 Tax=Patiriisocius sp. Uisw_047 TaxID=3230969 RepID=UPI0039EB4795